MNNLRNIALALHNYHDHYGAFPPAYLADENGRPAHSWRVLILPYLDQVDLYRQYRFDEPWDGPHNSKLADKIPDDYRCPSFAKYHSRHNLETAQTKQLTNYVAVTAADAIFSGVFPTTMSDVTDGLGNTLLVIEARHHSVHWMQPDDVSETEIVFDLQSAAHEHHANHLGGLDCAMADGRIRFLSSGIAPGLFHGLVTRKGGEKIGDF